MKTGAAYTHVSTLPSVSTGLYPFAMKMYVMWSEFHIGRIDICLGFPHNVKTVELYYTMEKTHPRNMAEVQEIAGKNRESFVWFLVQRFPTTGIRHTGTSFMTHQLKILYLS